ncbi:hypothetical protein C7M84_008484 [Penaeus vannamei]|uniref:Uncharacterized protein n=1 Tax=Penaeus vannamei TaxID=6689 RepID=A0A3R7P1V5_PENVA|nr:hypothetical protein C7M84_008484 [Penaeus vannamei]
MPRLPFSPLSIPYISSTSQPPYNPPSPIPKANIYSVSIPAIPLPFASAPPNSLPSSPPTPPTQSPSPCHPSSGRGFWGGGGLEAEGDLRSFSERREHFRSRDPASGQELFTQESRPPELVQLYRDATETPIHIMREIDQLRDDGIRSSRFFLCEPVLGDSLKKEKLRKLNLDIETRRGTGAGGKGRHASNMEWDAGEGSGASFRNHGRPDVLF